MIPLSDVAKGMLNGYSYRIHSRLQSWLGSTLLATDIPAFEVAEENDATLRVPERLTFKVPLEDDQGKSWVPLSAKSPLGWFGQRIVAQIGISIGSDEIEWINRGTFRLWSADTGDGVIDVEALGLLQAVDQAQLRQEYQPKTGATLQSAVRAMVEPGITVNFDSAPTNRTVSSNISWSDNRLDNVLAVFDAWPAYAVINQEGHLEVTAPLSDPVAGSQVFTFTDGANGTVMEFNTSGSQDGAFNAVVAKGVYPDTAGSKSGQEIIVTAYDINPASPFYIYGEFSKFLVPYGYESPLLTTWEQTLIAAQTRLAVLRRTASTTVRISCVPHPALQPGDPVAVTSTRLGLSAAMGRIESQSLPHQADGGAMGVTVRLV